ncbi:GatB/YqeY domain-containing protein [Swingsia samuiensis]|uniref:GatB/YqeY domain-containing protein n=1 Tax=Swingsia samuiensis TaxID=1293412 RepID=A0A4Y6UII4_9PROT|nr:GatB/YqeY domain-containing protein [Swingsia samuiensis]QDH16428.1 GatB/YqeY domain-containing protein [Swingsia samuiensis]
MSLRTKIMDDLKIAMKAGQSEKVAQIRGITAKLKDLEVAARAKTGEVSEADIISTLRSMIKSRKESAELYRKGDRPELAEKEEGEIATIQSYLPPELDENTLKSAIDEAVIKVGAESMKDMGKIMAELKERFGTDLDPAKASSLVKAKLA